MSPAAEHPVFRVAGISFLRIPAVDPRRSAAFYEAVFGWSVLERRLDWIGAHGGEVVTPPYPEGDLSVATFRDLAGNVVGVWQQGPMNS